MNYTISAASGPIFTAPLTCITDEMLKQQYNIYSSSVKDNWPETETTNFGKSINGIEESVDYN